MLCDSAEDIQPIPGNHFETSEIYEQGNFKWDNIVAKPVISPMFNPLKKK